MKIQMKLSPDLKQILKDNNIEKYETAYNGESVGLDLYSTKDMVLESNSRNLIPTGLFLALPKGFVGIIKERGSIVKTRLIVRAGVIDPNFTSEIFVSLDPLEDEATVSITKGQKLPAQMVVVKAETEYEEVSELEYEALVVESKRRSGQIGSSDK